MGNRNNKKNDRMVNTIFAILLFGSLILFAGIPAINVADTLSHATSNVSSNITK